MTFRACGELREGAQQRRSGSGTSGFRVSSVRDRGAQLRAARKTLELRDQRGVVRGAKVALYVQELRAQRHILVHLQRYFGARLVQQADHQMIVFVAITFEQSIQTSTSTGVFAKARFGERQLTLRLE